MKKALTMTRLYKYIEQVIYSGIAFGSILLAGLFMNAQAFFQFALMMTVVQGVVFFVNSYENNAILVFYHKYGSRWLHTLQQYKFIAGNLFSAILSAFAAGWLCTVDEFRLGYGTAFLLIYLLSGLIIAVETMRKVRFAAGEFSILIKHALLLASLFSLLALVAFVFTEQVANYFIHGLIVIYALVAMIARPSMSFSDIESIRLKKICIDNFHYSKWLLCSSVGIWLMSQGLLLLSEQALSIQQFNGLRLLLSFIGIANIVTLVFENSLTTQFAQRTELKLLDVYIALRKILFLSLLLIMGVCIIVAGSFWLVYPEYVVLLSASWPLLVSIGFFSLSKPFIAFLKAKNRTNEIFMAIAVGVTSTLAMLGLGPEAADYNWVIMIFAVGPVAMFLTLFAVIHANATR